MVISSIHKAWFTNIDADVDADAGKEMNPIPASASASISKDAACVKPVSLMLMLSSTSASILSTTPRAHIVCLCVFVCMCVFMCVCDTRLRPSSICNQNWHTLGIQRAKFA